MNANAAELTVARDMGYPDPVPLSLNEFGDLSAEEFIQMQNNNGQPSEEPPPIISSSINESGSASAKRSSSTFDNAFDQDNIFLPKYKEWCLAHGNAYEEYRLQMLASNLQEGDDQETEAEFNYVDETEMETQRIRQEYFEWCQLNEKEYDESRLETFATNLLAIEKFRAETGMNAELNAYADLSPEEYDIMMASEANTVIFNAGSPAYNQGSSYLESLSVSSPPTITDDVISMVYRDWCEYYDKQPSQWGLLCFSKNYNDIELYYSRTGEALDMNEYADLPDYFQEIISGEEEQLRRLEDSLYVKKEEIERIKLAQRNEEARQKAEKAMLSMEEEEDRKRAEEIERLQQKRIELETNLKADRAKLEIEKKSEAEAKASLEETNRQIDEIMKDDEQDEEEISETIALPRSSYMNAVAKTWFDRSSYLEALKQGKTGALPNKRMTLEIPKNIRKTLGIPNIRKTLGIPKNSVESLESRAEKDQLSESKESKSLFDAIWKFIKQ